MIKRVDSLICIMAKKRWSDAFLKDDFKKRFFSSPVFVVLKSGVVRENLARRDVEVDVKSHMEDDHAPYVSPRKPLSKTNLR